MANKATLIHVHSPRTRVLPPTINVCIRKQLPEGLIDYCFVGEVEKAKPLIRKKIAGGGSVLVVLDSSLGNAGEELAAWLDEQKIPFGTLSFAPDADPPREGERFRVEPKELNGFILSLPKRFKEPVGTGV